MFDINQADDTYINSFVKEFMTDNSSEVAKLLPKLYGRSKLAIAALEKSLAIELEKACRSFVSNNHDPSYIHSYLFATIHKTIGHIKNDGKPSIYICPACKYLNDIQVCIVKDKMLVCNACSNKLVNVENKQEETLYTTFSLHSINGYRCDSCDNFIPAGINRCPYPNCATISSNKKMRHPYIKTRLEFPSLAITTGNLFPSSTINTEQHSAKEDIGIYYNTLINTIDTQMSMLEYNSNASTFTSKTCMYIAFKNMINKYPEEMISYLVYLDRSCRIQHKIFQEFISILEKELPFSYIQDGKEYVVKSLLDEKLPIFDGVSEYVAIVDKKHQIANLTQELYTGSKVARPYYIGKLIDILDDGGKSLMRRVKEYSFSNITLSKTIRPHTRVYVKHLRIPPHPQMGGLVYLNRIRRSIVDRVYYSLNGKKRVIKR